MKNIKILTSWVLVLVLMVIIFNFSNQESIISSSNSTSLTEKIFSLCKLDKILMFDSFHGLIRKIAHFSVYCLLGYLVYNAIYYSCKKDYIYLLALTILIVLIYAGSDEIHQLFVRGRSGEFRDVIIDTSGGSIGGMIYYFYLKIGSGIHDLAKR